VKRCHIPEELCQQCISLPRAVSGSYGGLNKEPYLAQKIPRLLWNPSFPFCVRKNSSLVLIMSQINPLNTELHPVCHLLALLAAHHIFHVSRVRVNPVQIMPCFCSIHICLCTPTHPLWFLPFCFPNNTLYAFPMFSTWYSTVHFRYLEVY
jgi:hypothetical protein